MSLLEYNHDILSHDEFLDLIVLAQAGDLVARNTIIEKNVKLVLKNAFAASKRLTLDIDDLIQHGIFGLIRAIEKFDPTKINSLTGKPFAFSTYATWWIKQSIDRETAMTNQPIRLPIHAVKKFAQYKQIIQYMLKAEIPLTDSNIEETSQGFNFSAAELKIFKAIPTICSEEGLLTNYKTHEERSTSVYDNTIDESSDFAHSIEQEDLYNHLLEMCKDVLSPKEFGVLQLRFGLNGTEPMILEDIGIIYSLTRERVRQIQQRALAKLKIAYVRKYGEDYVETALR